ncbi:MAG: hypothetical protein DRG27_00600 [Deltaproteobacteria bacterium]|nr:MAG: hypothetical protein DRG27_00600 [Deltaproteobacteria bacterium]
MLECSVAWLLGWLVAGMIAWLFAGWLVRFGCVATERVIMALMVKVWRRSGIGIFTVQVTVAHLVRYVSVSIPFIS